MFSSFFNAGKPTYEIEQSLRFDGAASLTRTQATPTNGNIVTVSAWIKKTTDQDFQGWMGADAGTSTSGAELKFNAAANSQIGLYNELTNGSRGVYFESHASYRDPSAWMHVVSVYQNSSTPADSPTYVNGVQITGTSGSAGSNPGAGWGDAAPQWNMSGVIQSVGSCTTTSYRLRYLHGYLAEVIQVDGQALDQYDFGEFDDNGVWRPIKYTGTYGNNGFYLKFDPSATNGVGHDHSGNGNHFTASGFTTSGTGTDVMSDTPTKNFCTMNPLFPSGAALSNGNLYGYLTSDGVTGTIGPTSGKWYYEVSVESLTTNAYIGIADDTLFKGDSSFTYSQTYLYLATALKGGNGSTTSYGATYGAGDVIGVAFDLDTPSIRFYKNGVDQGEAFNSLNNSGSAYRPFAWTQTGGHTYNFGQRDFAYTPPTGFKALNTSNLPAPTVKDGSEYFNTVLYSGYTNNTQNITGVGFQPDWTWIKSRNSTDSPTLSDAVRGAGIALRTNNTAAEADNSSSFTSFDTDGFTVAGGSGDTNQTGNNYVAWNWLASNTSGSSNTDGTITSTVSANPTAGFSIVAYTGNGSNSQTVGHGLGVAPRMCIGKSRGSNSWFIRHESLGSNLNLNFNSSGTVTPGGGGLIGDLTSSTTISLPGGSNAGSGNMNANGTNYIMYCFAEVEGYSKFSKYSSNNSSDGPFVYLGFRPAFILIRDTGSNNWVLQDSDRVTYNPVNKSVSPDNSNGDASDAVVDFLSNGFKIRTNWSGINYTSGNTYIYAAFSENPFGGSGVSPATAR